MTLLCREEHDRHEKLICPEKKGKKGMKKERVIPPLLFAIYPVLALFAHNKALVATHQIIIPLLVVALSVLLLYFVLSLLFLNNRKKAGIFLSLFVLLFFSYGHLYYFLRDFKPEVAGHTMDAYYLPGGGDQKLYPSISPVNSFRVIFNRYFKTNYPLLEDRSCFSTWSRPYRFFDVTDRIQ